MAAAGGPAAGAPRDGAQIGARCGVRPSPSIHHLGRRPPLRHASVSRCRQNVPAAIRNGYVRSQDVTVTDVGADEGSSRSSRALARIRTDVKTMKALDAHKLMFAPLTRWPTSSELVCSDHRIFPTRDGLQRRPVCTLRCASTRPGHDYRAIVARATYTWQASRPFDARSAAVAPSLRDEPPCRSGRTGRAALFEQAKNRRVAEPEPAAAHARIGCGMSTLSMRPYWTASWALISRSRPGRVFLDFLDRIPVICTRAFSIPADASVSRRSSRERRADAIDARKKDTPSIRSLSRRFSRTISPMSDAWPW